MAKAEGDGQKVNIPLLAICAMGWRSVVLWADYWISVCASRMNCRQIRNSQVRDTHRDVGSPMLSYKSTLPRKISKLYHIVIRTANRHRWSGRVDQDERVSVPQGTRQKSSRNFGIRLPPIMVNFSIYIVVHHYGGRSESISGNCLPKTQLPANS